MTELRRPWGFIPILKSFRQFTSVSIRGLFNPAELPLRPDRSVRRVRGLGLFDDPGIY